MTEVRPVGGEQDAHAPPSGPARPCGGAIRESSPGVDGAAPRAYGLSATRTSVIGASGQVSPCFMAMAAAVVRLGAPSLERMLLTCRRTVPTLSVSRSAISLLLSPAARSASTSRSRGGQVVADVVLAAVHERARHAAVDGAASVDGVPDGLRERLRARVLEQVADRARRRAPSRPTPGR